MYRIWIVVVLALTAGIVHAAEAPRINVLFIMSDDYRPELGCYGSPALTPRLDRLAKSGVQFDRAYCQQAVCNPSRSSMLTGLRPDTLKLWCNGTHFREYNPYVVTMPQWFMQHGYTTRCVGKIFHNWHNAVHGDRQSWSAPEFLHFASHIDDKPLIDGALPTDHSKAPKCECRDVPDEAYFDGRVAAEAIRVLGEVKGGPFFLAVGFWKPHAPFNAPKKYWDLVDRDKLPKLNPARPEGAPEVAFHDGRELRGIPPNQATFTSEEAAEIRHGYFANIAYLDAQLGKLLDALAASGVADRTVIVFAGDHGYHIGEQGLWGKTSNFELDAHVPLLIAAPGAAAGRRTESLTELLDLYPTLVDLCGLPKPNGLEGASLVPVLRDPSKSVKPAAFSQHPRPAYYDREPSKTPEAMGHSVRTALVRYTEWRDWSTGKVIARELYDAVNDPAEMRNAIDASHLAAARAEAETLLHKQFPVRK